MSQTIPIIINLLAAVIGAIGQYCYKIGAQKLKVVPIHQNWQVIIGAILFTVVMVMILWAFKLGGKLSTTFPAYATTFVWGTIIGVFLDNESFNWIQGIGIVFVVLGISLVAVFSRSI